jgi:anthranilate/para-aminobenzoate synthase component I
MSSLSHDLGRVSPPAPGPSCAVGAVGPTVGEDAYAEAFERVKRHILDGDTYQVNGTLTLEADAPSDPLALFLDLVHAQRGRYAAWLRLGRHDICSASPELFLARRGSRLVARPMKGSAGRGWRSLHLDMHSAS